MGFGGVFLGERPAWTSYAGMALILAGLVFVDGRLIPRFVAGLQSSGMPPARGIRSSRR